MAADDEASKLVEFMVRAIVSQPDAVKVTMADEGRVLELETASEDRGRVIGRQGRVAKAMRAILTASAVGSHCRLEILD